MKYLVDDEIVVDSDIVVKSDPIVDADIIDGDRVSVDSDIVTPYAVIKEYIPIDIPPTVTPLQIIDYSISSIECAFDVTTEQAEEVVKGVLCGTINPPTFENADYRLLHGQGSMDLAFAGLHRNTEYYLRPYALSNLGYKYGDVVTQRTKASPIPDEYQLVEYLQSTGTQYIATGVIQSRIAVWKLTMRVDATPSQNTGCGERNGYFSTLGCLSTGILYAHWGSGNKEVGIMPNNYKFNKFELHVPLGYCKINDTQVGLSTDASTGREIYLFLQNGELQRQFLASIAESEYIDVANNIISHLYPVYRKSDNKPGMYDIVNNIFRTNQGTLEFTVGPDKEWEE